MPFIIGANSAGGDFSVDNSCRFNSADTAYLTRTCGSTASSYTVSMWVKTSRTSGTTTSALWWNAATSKLNWELNDHGQFYYYDASTPRTTGFYRDTGAWYHLVFKVDSNTGTLYINGAAADGITGVGSILSLQTGNALQIGGDNGGSTFEGYIAEVCFIDGTALDPDQFGEFNEDSPTIWQPIAVSGLTFGTKGFYLDFEDSSDLGKDVSGNGNDLTATNLAAIDQTTDTPVNNFNILNANNPSGNDFTISEGATKITKTGSGHNLGGYLATLMPTTGKWYFEALIDEAGDGDRGRVGLANYESVTGTSVIQGNYSGLEVSLKAAKLFVTINGTTTETTASGDYADGDIVNIAMDLDNNAIYVGRNGTWLTLTGTSGGDPTSGASKTGAIVTDTTYILNGTPMCTYFGSSVGGVSDTSTVSYNFGNPAFTISSGNADADGYGNFEYAVPSGYFALCTKNLGAYGG